MASGSPSTRPLASEHRYPVAPLALPLDEDDAEALALVPAVALFCERARAHQCQCLAARRGEIGPQIADDDLEEVLGTIEVLEPVLTKIPERDVGRQFVGDQLACGARNQHLPTLAGRADPRRAMHVQADVVIQPDLRLAGVHADAHAHLDALGPTLGRRRALRAHGGGDRVARSPEGDEEPVTLGMDLAPVVLLERRAQQALMLGQHLGVATAQPRQQSRRTLDVTEQERDGAAR